MRILLFLMLGLAFSYASYSVWAAGVSKSSNTAKAASASSKQAHTDARFKHPDGDKVVDIINNDAQKIGTITLKQGRVGAMAVINLTGIPAGSHGFHIHKMGMCDHDTGFKTASGHTNPSKNAHGYLNENGPDAGDLPNLIAHEDGTVNAEIFIPQHDIAELLDKDGSAFMIHENPDDHITQPIGGAGARIACGIIGVPHNAHNSEHTHSH